MICRNVAEAIEKAAAVLFLHVIQLLIRHKSLASQAYKYMELWTGTFFSSYS